MQTRDLTVDLITEIADEIQVGNYPRTVCQRRQISVNTFNRWMERGNELVIQQDSGVDMSRLDREDGLLLAFAIEVNLAFANAEVEMLQWAKDLAGMGKSTWTMPFTWLERCRPGWQRRDQMAPEQSADAELVKLSKQFESFEKARPT